MPGEAGGVLSVASCGASVAIGLLALTVSAVASLVPPVVRVVEEIDKETSGAAGAVDVEEILDTSVDKDETNEVSVGPAIASIRLDEMTTAIVVGSDGAAVLPDPVQSRGLVETVCDSVLGKAPAGQRQ